LGGVLVARLFKGAEEERMKRHYVKKEGALLPHA